MSKRFACAIIIAIAALGCGDDQDPEGARALWNRIHTEGYNGWQRPIGYETRKASFTSHERAVEIFMNDAMAKKSRAEKFDGWPAGATVVKESYDADRQLVAVAAMERRESGWFWAEWNRNGQSTYSGTPSVCTDCHGRSHWDGPWTIGHE